MSNQPPRRPGMEEFGATIGEAQRHGDARVKALTRNPNLPPLPRPAPGTAAARALAAVELPLQVVSMFDTRPVGGFDFVATFTTTNNFDPPTPFGGITCPIGYTMILRRVEFMPFPTFTGNTMGDALIVRLTYDDNVIPMNEQKFWGTFDDAGWDTHQVAGQGHRLGVVWEIQNAPASGVVYDIPFRMLGTLVRTNGRPAEVEVGSPPIITMK